MKSAAGFSSEKGFACQPGGGSGFFFSCARAPLAVRADATKTARNAALTVPPPSASRLRGERGGEGLFGAREAQQPLPLVGDPERAVGPQGQPLLLAPRQGLVRVDRPVGRDDQEPVGAVRDHEQPPEPLAPRDGGQVVVGLQGVPGDDIRGAQRAGAPRGVEGQRDEARGLALMDEVEDAPTGPSRLGAKDDPLEPLVPVRGLAAEDRRRRRAESARSRRTRPGPTPRALPSSPRAGRAARSGAWTVTSSRLPFTRCVATTPPEASSSVRDPRSPTTKKRPRDGCQAMPDASRTPAAAIASGFPRPGAAGSGHARVVRGERCRGGAPRTRLEEQHGQGQDGEEASGQDGQHAQPAVQPPQRAELVEVDARHDVVLHGELGVELAKPHLAPRAPVGLEVPEDDVLVVAQALGVVVGAALARVRHVRLEAPGAKGLDRLEKEEEGDPGVDEEVEAEEGPQPQRQVLDDLGSGGEEEEGDVERAHDHEGEARLAIRQLDEVLRLLERVHEGPVALPGVEGADRFGLELRLLLAPLRVVLRRHGRSLHERGRRLLLGHPGSIAGPAQMKPLSRGQRVAIGGFRPRATQIERPSS